jgi:hypothetical protein
VADVVGVFAGLSGREVLRSVRRTPPGRSLSEDEVGGLVGLSAFTIRRFVRARLLLASTGCGSPYRIGEGDLGWFMANRHVPRGRGRRG